MQGAPSTTHRRESPFRGFDQSVERLLEADMRLMYGMAVPILMIVGLIIVLALHPATWLATAVVVVEIAVLAVVVLGFVGMLNDDDEEEEDDARLT